MPLHRLLTLSVDDLVPIAVDEVEAPRALEALEPPREDEDLGALIAGSFANQVPLPTPVPSCWFDKARKYEYPGFNPHLT